eukprot:TRINITY_DN230_c0_g1_i2.p1 TRINITY_DN230_c0_g1~~TRINITY_DN230_c0_g1_i2.p1  ORF type:complete len:930 (+),score=433.23 TRINITY_DN230_c0_g1_i2:304-3093(+)
MLRKDNIAVTASAEQIYEGNIKMILGLTWMMIQKFQIAQGDGGDHQAGGKPKSAKESILEWLREYLKDYPCSLDGFPKCFADGKVFQYMVHRKDPSLIDLTAVDGKNPIQRMGEAFDKAATFGVPKLLDPEMEPEELSILTYLSMFKARLGDVSTLEAVQATVATQIEEKTGELKSDLEEIKKKLAENSGKDSAFLAEQIQKLQEQLMKAQEDIKKGELDKMRMQEENNRVAAALQDLQNAKGASSQEVKDLEYKLEEVKKKLKEEVVKGVTTAQNQAKLEEEIADLKRRLEKSKNKRKEEKARHEEELANLKRRMENLSGDEEEKMKTVLELEALKRKQAEWEKDKERHNKRLQELKQKADTLQQEKDQMEEEHREQRSKQLTERVGQGRLELELEDERKKSLEKEDKIKKLKDKNTELEEKIKQAAADTSLLDKLRAEIEELKRQIAQEQKDKEELKSQLEEEQKKRAEADQTIKQLQDELEKAKQRVVELEKHGPTVIGTHEYADDKDELIGKLEKEIADLKKENARLRANQGSDNNAELARLQKETEDLIDELNRLNEENAKLNEENSRLRDENDKLLEENDALRGEAIGLSGENEKLKDENDKLNGENEKLSREVEDMRALTSDAMAKRKIRLNIERLIRQLYYRKGARMSERAAFKYLQEIHEADKHLEDLCGLVKERIKKMIDLHTKSLHDEEEVGRRGTDDLETEIDQLKKYKKELKEIKERWVVQYNTLGDLYKPKSNVEVDSEEIRKRLVGLADHPRKLEEENNLDDIIEDATKILADDRSALEEIYKQKPNRKETRKDVEQELDRLNTKLDDKYLKEVQRLKDFIANKDREAEYEEEAAASETDPTVIEYMIHNFDTLFGDFKKDPKNKDVHQLVVLPVDFIKKKALNVKDILAKDHYKPYAVNQIKSYAYRALIYHR